MQALAILFGASFTVAVCLALGAILLGSEDCDIPARFVCGAALLSLLVFLSCVLRMVWPATFLIAGGLALLVRHRDLILLMLNRSGKLAGLATAPARSRLSTRSARLLLAAFGVFMVLYFFNAMAPEISYDGSRYHLGLVGRYLREHGFHPITDDLFASLPQAVEMLYLFAFAFGRHSAASLVHLAFLLALTWGIWDHGRRSGFALAGAVAALLVFASPMMGVDASSAYNDVAVAAIAFTLYTVLQRWSVERSRRLLVAAGLLAGFGFAAKYTAWPGVAYACAVPLFARKHAGRWGATALVALCAGVIALPWLAKNWLFVQNPAAPFFNHWFPNHYVMPSFERELRQTMGAYTLSSRWQIPLQVTTRGSLGGLLGPVFLLSPLALVSLRHSEGRRLLMAALIFGLNYFSNISTRFLLPSLPFVALALALTLSTVPRLAAAIAVIHAILSWPSVLIRYCAPDAWHLVKVPYREALRIKPEDGFLESNLPLYGATRMVERLATPGSTVFMSTPIPEAYTSRKILVAYQSASNFISRNVLWTGFVPEFAPTWQLHFAFPRQPLRAIRIVQTNHGKDSWSMNEIHVRDGAAELPHSGWRLTAEPFPWGVDKAFDGNLATFWLCGDTLEPGQFVQMDFEQTQPADHVLIEAAPNQWGLRLRLEGLDPDGKWRALASEPQIENVAPQPGLRRAAAEELKRRGIGYLLWFDGEFAADDLRQNAEQWGIRQVGEYKGARLYQLP